MGFALGLTRRRPTAGRLERRTGSASAPAGAGTSAKEHVA
jgi:hypothetical protein